MVSPSVMTSKHDLCPHHIPVEIPTKMWSSTSDISRSFLAALTAICTMYGIHRAIVLAPDVSDRGRRTGC